MSRWTIVSGAGIMLLLFLLPARAPIAAQLGPAAATGQMDPSGLTGSWIARSHEDGTPDEQLLGEYMGIPLNDEGRARSDAWQSSYQEMAERQCIPYSSGFLVIGIVANFQMWSETDPIADKVIAWKMKWYFGTRTIWMDGRPHPPPEAQHTGFGFSTGEWVGDALHIRTTHLTESMIWQSGVPSSNQATLNEFIVRNGDTLTLTSILDDPIYLEEPFVRTKTLVSDPTMRVTFTTCEPATEVPRETAEVPHYLPGKNPHLTEGSEALGIPLEAVRGGAATLYPEYQKKLKEQYKRPTTLPEYLKAHRGVK